MRITGGKARGRVLRAPVRDGVRPTSSRVREALFSMVGQDLEGVRVLDAFGGAGLLGLEAWSRGAEVTIVERRPHVARAIRDTAAALGAEVQVVNADVLQVAAELGPFDGVVADPPYALPADRILPVLAEVAGEWLVYEADHKAQAPLAAGPLVFDRKRAFGNTALWLYLPADNP